MRSTLIAALLAMLVGACVASEAFTDAAESGGIRTYSTDSGDQMLAAYGKENPSCRMWSNWRSLCARTGADGGIHCATDPDRPVAPSEPFCASQTISDLPAREQASAMRFCLARLRPLDGESIEENLLRARSCARHDPNRPFNGRRVHGLLRPGCDALAHADSGTLVCTRGGDPGSGLPDCADLASGGYESDGLLSCARWSGPPTCHAYPVKDDEPPTPGSIFFGAQNPDRAPVHGLMCENR